MILSALLVVYGAWAWPCSFEALDFFEIDWLYVVMVFRNAG